MVEEALRSIQLAHSSASVSPRQIFTSAVVKGATLGRRKKFQLHNRDSGFPSSTKKLVVDLA
jgi:hypothetical protein